MHNMLLARGIVGQPPLQSLSLEEQGNLFEQWFLLFFYGSCSPLED
ncbi:MAG: hypothetical protein ACOX2K_00210 [Bacillota bacterium]